MSKSFWIALLVLFLSLTSATNIWADTPLKGGCPGTFELHSAEPHDHHHGHKHVGTSTDLNGDGWICVKHVASDGVHVHIDNNAALP